MPLHFNIREEKNGIGRKCRPSLLRVLDKSSTGTDTRTDPSAASRLHRWSIHHLGEHERAKSKRSAVGEPINSLDCGKKMGTADPADHPSPVGSTMGRIAQLDEEVRQDSSLYCIRTDCTACRYRILPVAS